MKKIFLLFLLIITGAFAQKKQQNFITIEGDVTGFKDGDKINLVDQYNGITLGLTNIKNNKFKFDKIKVEDATQFYIGIGEDGEWYDIKTFFSEINTTLKIVGDKKNLENCMIINSKLNDKHIEFNSISTKLNKKIDSIYNEVVELKKQGKWDTIIRKKYRGPNGIVDKIEGAILNKQKEYFFKNSNTIFAQKHLLRYYISDFSISELNAFYFSLTKENKKNKYGKLIQTYINNKQLLLGDSFYDISAEDENGIIHNFSDIIKDKYTLISFTSPYCPYNVDSIKDLLKLEIDSKEKINIVTYYIDSDKKEWIDFNKEKKIDWICLWNNNMRFSEAVAKYHISGTPTFYLFDKKGKMIKLFDGYDEDVFYKEIFEIIK